MAKEEALEVVEEGILMEVEEGANALELLTQHAATVAYDPGFMKIAANKGATSFNAGALGTMDGPLECIILSVSVNRALWPSDGTASLDQLAGLLQCMPDDIGKYSLADVKDWSNGRPLCTASGDGAKGTPTKVLDADAPPVVPIMLEPPAKAEFSCKTCRWNQFGTNLKGGKGKACKESHLLLMYFPAEDLAAFIAIPPTSIRAWKDYKISMPKQNFTAVFTEISTGPITKGDYTYNVFNFAPVKVKGAILPVEAKHLASLGELIVYQGCNVMKLEALLAEFLEIELEDENSVDGVDPLPTHSGPSADSGDEDQPF